MISQKYDSIKAHFGVVIGATYMSMDEGTTHLSIGDDHEIFNLGAQNVSSRQLCWSECLIPQQFMLP